MNNDTSPGAMYLFDPLTYRKCDAMGIFSPYKSYGSPIMISPSCKSSARARASAEARVVTGVGGVRLGVWVDMLVVSVVGGHHSSVHVTLS